MTERVTTRGGSRGIRANVLDMRAQADVLAQITDGAHRAGGQSRELATSQVLLRTSIFSPVTATRAEGVLVTCAGHATYLALRVEVQTTVLRARATLFEKADAARDVLDKALKIAYAAPVAWRLIEIEARTLVMSLTYEGGRSVVRIVTGQVPLDLIDDEFKEIPGRAVQDTLARGKRLLSEYPEATEIVTGGLAWGMTRKDNSPVKSDLEDAIARIQAIAGGRGLFVDRAVVVGEGTKIKESPKSAQALLKNIGDMTGKAKGDPKASAVRIVTVTNPGQPPRYIVEIPGTQEWDPHAGADPSDLTTNIEAMQRRGAMMQAVRDAMAKAQIPPGAQVMLAGHSQGGIVAAALASDRNFAARYHVAHVVTAGSPIADMPIPDNVQVTSFEHRQDLVPHLDGSPNPDRPNWTTYSRDVADAPGVARDALEAHNIDLYAETAKLVGQRPETSHDLDGANRFMHGQSTTTEYSLTRQ